MPESTQEQSILEAIDQIQSIANHLPLVIIIHELPELRIRHMSDLGLRLINATWEEIGPMPYEEFQNRYFNPDHFAEVAEKMVELITSGDDGMFASYFQQVRTSPTAEFDWYMNTTRVFLRKPNGEPLLLITTAMLVDREDPFITKAQKLLEENEFIRKNYPQFMKLGAREREVLRLLALGKSSAEIATELFISTATAETHRRNIRNKLKTTSYYDLHMYARAFDLI